MTESTFTAEQARALLDKLIADPDFREQLLGDPVAALGSLGIKVDASQVPAVRSLPPADVLKENRDALVAQLESRAGLWIFMVE